VVYRSPREDRTNTPISLFFCLAIPWFLNADSLSIVYEFHRRTVCCLWTSYCYGVIVVFRNSGSYLVGRLVRFVWFVLADMCIVRQL
jgi:hypothetical protein